MIDSNSFNTKLSDLQINPHAVVVIILIVIAPYEFKAFLTICSSTRYITS